MKFSMCGCSGFLADIGFESGKFEKSSVIQVVSSVKHVELLSSSYLFNIYNFSLFQIFPIANNFRESRV